MASIHSLLSSLLKVERRRYKRIPCTIKAHFFIAHKERQHRGDALITDVTLHGLCCNKLHFFYEDKNLHLKRNLSITIYFTLPLPNGNSHNFEIGGKIKSFLPQDSQGYAQRVGVEITAIEKKDKQIFRECVAFLEKSAAAQS